MKKRLIFAFVIILFLGSAFAAYYYFQTTRQVTINFSHITSATLQDSNGNKIAQLTKSGEKQRLAEGGQYIISYISEDTYQSGVKSFNTNETTTITVNPYYSDSRLDSLLNTEVDSVNAAIVAAYPKMNELYTVTSGHLYHYGDWYGAKLVYRGTDIFNSDDLRIIVHKQDGKWTVASTPPMPTLNTYSTTSGGSDSNDSHGPAISIPVDVLRAVNSL